MRTWHSRRVVNASRAAIRTLALCSALLVATAAAWTFGIDTGSHMTDAPVPWWALAIAFVVGELATFDIEFKRDSHTFTFSEVPLVLGLFFVTPVGLVAARLTGSAVVGVRERQGVLKLVFNLSMILTECSIALVVFQGVRGGAPLESPHSWLAAFVAVLVADLLDVVCVAFALRWHGAEPDPAQLVLAGGVTAVANTSLGLAAVILLWTNIAAAALLVVVAAVLLLGYRSYASIAQRYASLRLFYDFTNVVGTASRAEPVLEAILHKSRELLRAEVAEISIVADDERGQVLRLAVRDDEPIASSEMTSRLLEPEWLHETVVGNQQLVVIARGTKDDDRTAFLASHRVRDAMVAPLVGKAGVIGTITVAERLGELNTFDAEAERLFATLANHASVAIENGKLIDQLNREIREREHQALHDALTGLPNRSLFFRRVAQTMRAANDSPFAVMLMDLDGFKELNDTLGHHNGDLLLQEIADRLPAMLPAGATVARLGGDEFAVVLPTITNRDDAVAIAEVIRQELVQPFEIEDVMLEVGGSIGIAMWPEHARDASDLLKCADVAMYGAKTSSTGIETYHPERDEHTLERLTIAAQLRRTIDDDGLTVHYQPIVRLADGAVTGTEALVRWTHAERGPVRPIDFIGVAERTGLIRPLTTFVLRTALEQCHEWRQDGHELAVSVNLSARSLLDLELPDEVEHIIAEARAEPSWLTFEITESTIMDPRRGMNVLDRLAAIGVRLAIDDFGTGYSSLAYLQRLPVHELKVDQSFVMKLDADSHNVPIVRAVVDLAHNLGLQIVAEGVETRAGWDQLRAMHCDTGQGYFLSRPVPAPVLTAWLRDRAAPEARRRGLVPAGLV